MSEKKTVPGTVYLVGAGSGDDGLLTLRGAELLSRVDAIVYDALANPSFLQKRKAGSEIYFVGKTPGAHSAKQEEINALLVRLAREGKNVVRLKGGDPFVFGRGGEEAQALEEAGLPYQLLPGVTSAVAALESAGIPVTHREVARSFTVITGHVAAKSGTVSRFSQYAAIDGTLVFLMGVAALPEITRALLAGGKAAETPVAMVEWGTTVRERRINATLSTAVAVAEREQVQNPAVICVGDVAAFDFTSRRLPLAKKRIAVTGTPQLTEKLSASLKEAGALVYSAPYMRVEEAPHQLSTLPPLSTVSWLIFTSASGVRVFFDSLLAGGGDLRALSHLRFAVVGPGTAGSLRGYGFTADYLPERYTVASLAEGFARRWKQEAAGKAIGAASSSACVSHGVAGAENASRPGIVLLLRAADGSPDLQAAFDREQIPYRDIPLYALSCDSLLCQSLLQQVDVLDYLTFASSSGARAFFEAYAAARTQSAAQTAPVPLNPACSFVCIGEKTKETVDCYCQDLGLKNRVLLAESYTAAGITRTLLADCS